MIPTTTLSRRREIATPDDFAATCDAAITDAVAADEAATADTKLRRETSEVTAARPGSTGLMARSFKQLTAGWFARSSSWQRPPAESNQCQSVDSLWVRSGNSVRTLVRLRFGANFQFGPVSARVGLLTSWNCRGTGNNSYLEPSSGRANHLGCRRIDNLLSFYAVTICESQLQFVAFRQNTPENCGVRISLRMN